MAHNEVGKDEMPLGLKFVSEYSSKEREKARKIEESILDLMSM